MREQLRDAIVETMAETHLRFGFRSGYDIVNDCYFLMVIKVTPRFEIRSCINLTEILDKHLHDNGEFYKAVCAEVNTAIESIEREEGREVMPLARVLTENEMRQLRSMEAIEHVRVLQMEEDHND